MRNVKIKSRFNIDSNLLYILNSLIIFQLILLHVEPLKSYQPIFYIIISLCVLIIVFQKTFYFSKDFFWYIFIILIISLFTINTLSIIYLLSMSIIVLWFNSLYDIKKYGYLIISLLILSTLIPSYDGFGYSGLYGNNITFAGMMFFSLYLTLSLDFGRIFKFFLFIFIFSMLIIAQSKTHILISVCLIIGYYFPKFINKFSRLFFFLSFFAPILFMLLLNNVISEYDVTNLTLGDRNIFDLSGRNKIYDILPAFIYEFPFGVGLGNSQDTIMNYFNLNISSAHNAWIKSIFETSVLGLLAFVIFVYLRLKTMRPLSILFLCLLNIKFSFEIFTPLGMSFLSLMFMYPILENLKPKLNYE